MVVLPQSDVTGAGVSPGVRSAEGVRSARGARCADDRGASLVVVVLAIIPIFVFAAFAVDLGAMRAWRRQSQNSVDAAALAGAQNLLSTGSRQIAADYAVKDLLGSPSAGAPGGCAASDFQRATLPVLASCWTVTRNGQTVHVAVSTPFPRTAIQNLSSSVTSDGQLIWVLACKSVRTEMARVIGINDRPVCTEAVARGVRGTPKPAIFAIKSRTQCQNSVGVNPGGEMKVYDAAGNPSGLIFSNCPIKLESASLDNSPNVDVRSTGTITGSPSSGWGSILHAGGQPVLTDPWSAGGAEAIPNLQWQFADCYPDDPGTLFNDCKARSGPVTTLAVPGVGNVKIWAPGHYGNGQKLAAGSINYFLPGIYYFEANLSWDASNGTKVMMLTNNGLSYTNPTDPGCADLTGLLDPSLLSCPPPKTGTASPSNRGGGGMIYLGSGQGASDMYGINTFRWYPVQSGPYAGFSYFCDRPNNPNSGSDQNQLDGPLNGDASKYDLHGIFYCRDRQIEVHGNLTIRDGALWANDVEWDGGANIRVYQPASWGNAGNQTDFGLER